MKKILVIAIVCLLGSFAAAAQTVKVNGTIVDEPKIRKQSQWQSQLQ